VAWLLDRPAERYRLRLDASDSTTDVVTLVPRDSTLPFRMATVAFARSDGLPRRIDLVEDRGTRRSLTLSAVRAGRRLPSSTFRFAVPDGVRVVDQ
jgi:outer membrane lipoprotein-sorting protein